MSNTNASDALIKSTLNMMGEYIDGVRKGLYKITKSDYKPFNDIHTPWLTAINVWDVAKNKIIDGRNIFARDRRRFCAEAHKLYNYS